MRRYRHVLGMKFKTPLTIRLTREFDDLRKLEADSTILSMKAEGDPPDHYTFTFRGQSLVPGRGDQKVKLGDLQQVEISLGTEYPRRKPEVRWLTEIVHPNISGGSVCLGNFASNWNPNIRLADLVEILWDMSRMAIFNVHSAYGTHGVTWPELDQKFGFPVDKRPLRNKVLPNDVGSSVVRPDGGKNDIVILNDDSSACQFLE